jgi:hypothetical protein
MIRCDGCGSGVEQEDIVFYADDERQKVQIVCRECDADIQWVRNPLFPALTKNQLLYGSFK